MKNLFVLLLVFFATSLHASHFQQTTVISKVTVLVVYQQNTQQSEGIVLNLKTPQPTTIIFTELRFNSNKGQNNEVKTGSFTANAQLDNNDQMYPAYELTGSAPEFYSNTERQGNETNLNELKYDFATQSNPRWVSGDSLTSATPNEQLSDYVLPASNSLNYSTLSLLNKSAKNPNQIMF